MRVPEEIRNVPRPENTVILDKGPDNYPYRYVVQARANNKSAEYDRNIVLGYIVDMKFVPFVPIEFSFSFGGCAFAHSVSEDIHKDLIDVFGHDDGDYLYAIGLMRAVKPYLTQDRLASFYMNSYVSRVIPNLNLSTDNMQSTIASVDSSLIPKYFDAAGRRCGGAPCDTVVAVLCEDQKKTYKCGYDPSTWEIMYVDGSSASRAKKGRGGFEAHSSIQMMLLERFPLLRAAPGMDSEIRDFVDCISLSISMKMAKAVSDKEELKDVPFNDVIETLNTCFKDYKTTVPDMLNDSNWSWLPSECVKYLNALGFMQPIERKRRRVPWRRKQ